jgi:hypothetical protein
MAVGSDCAVPAVFAIPVKTNTITWLNDREDGELRIKNDEMTVGIPENCASPLNPPLLRRGRGCVKKLRMQN